MAISAYAAVVHRGRTIYVAVVGVEGEYRATPIVCELGDPPHAKTSRRIRIEKTFTTRAGARTYGIATARVWIDRELDEGAAG